MGIPNVFALAHVTLYIIIFMVSFFICVPVGVNVTDFKGHCLLHATGSWSVQSPQSSRLENVQWGPVSACNFTIFIGVVSLILSLFYAAWTSIILARGIESSWLDAFLNFIINSAMTIFTFSDALTISIGFREWCQLLTDPRSGLKDCENGQYVDILTNYNIDSSDYFTQWEVAQFGVWFSWIVWLVLSIMSLTRLYSYHRQEAISVSMNRERQRLLQKATRTEEA